MATASSVLDQYEAKATAVAASLVQVNRLLRIAAISGAPDDLSKAARACNAAIRHFMLSPMQEDWCVLCARNGFVRQLAAACSKLLPWGVAELTRLREAAPDQRAVSATARGRRLKHVEVQQARTTQQQVQMACVISATGLTCVAFSYCPESLNPELLQQVSVALASTGALERVCEAALQLPDVEDVVACALDLLAWVAHRDERCERHYALLGTGANDSSETAAAAEAPRISTLPDHPAVLQLSAAGAWSGCVALSGVPLPVLPGIKPLPCLGSAAAWASMLQLGQSTWVYTLRSFVTLLASMGPAEIAPLLPLGTTAIVLAASLALTTRCLAGRGLPGTRSLDLMQGSTTYEFWTRSSHFLWRLKDEGLLPLSEQQGREAFIALLMDTTDALCSCYVDMVDQYQAGSTEPQLQAARAAVLLSALHNLFQALQPCGADLELLHRMVGVLERVVRRVASSPPPPREGQLETLPRLSGHEVKQLDLMVVNDALMVLASAGQGLHWALQEDSELLSIERSKRYTLCMVGAVCTAIKVTSVFLSRTGSGTAELMLLCSMFQYSVRVLYHTFRVLQQLERSTTSSTSTAQASKWSSAQLLPLLPQLTSQFHAVLSLAQGQQDLAEYRRALLCTGASALMSCINDCVSGLGGGGPQALQWLAGDIRGVLAALHADQSWVGQPVLSLQGLSELVLKLEQHLLAPTAVMATCCCCSTPEERSRAGGVTGSSGSGRPSNGGDGSGASVPHQDTTAVDHQQSAAPAALEGRCEDQAAAPRLILLRHALSLFQAVSQAADLGGSRGTHTREAAHSLIVQADTCSVPGSSGSSSSSGRCEDDGQQGTGSSSSAGDTAAGAVQQVQAVRQPEAVQPV
mmetsp:Transcript_3121/g.6795  ORF Transcript_3121/g.6795 Transcript_3121/m.6795 type:complete len:864 (+) Transcript_3121:437-3028(+)